MRDLERNTCPTCGQDRPPTHTSNAPFRRAALRLISHEQTNYTTLGRYLGYGDDAGQRVQRDLGIAPDHYKGRQKMRQSLTVERGLRYCEALGLDPVEVGL